MPPSTASSSSYASGSDLNQRKGDVPVLLLAPPPPKKPKHQSPQDSIDEFWSKFNSKTPGRASTILPKNVYAQKAGEKVPKGVVEGENAVACYEEAVRICKAKVEKIVKECRRVNQKYRDSHFDIEFDLKWGTKDCLRMLGESSDHSFRPGSVKRVGDIFDKPQFYIGGATANDIRQGRDGDCWFMAALCTLSNKKDLIERVCVARNEEIGVYGFVFHRDGEWISEIIDDKLYLTKPDYDESWMERNLIEDRQRINSEEEYRKIYQSNSGALYFAQCEDPNETWLPLLEKAYAKAHGDYGAIEGGFTGEGLEDLTGGVTTEILSTDILDKEYFWKEELLKVNQDFLFGCAAGIFWGRGYRKGIYEGHAYSVMRAVEIDDKRLLLLRNPWGQGEWTGPWSDGSKEWTPEWMQKLDHRFGDDGAFWMSYDDLLKKYQTFDRTRLFTDDWKVTQQWTSLTVPWTIDYHRTKFSFTLEKKAPVVIVLSQLDVRYFVGLEGQYTFELSFRVHKAGEEDYIVRSHGNYCMSRSVTAELELEAGEYHVLMKVAAVRNTDALPVEQVLRDNAKARRDKLLRIGLSYDLAHAKGQIKETTEEKDSRKAAEDKKKAKEMAELKEKMLKEKTKRKHSDNKEKRKVRAAKVKRAAKAAAKAAAKDKKETETETKPEVKDDTRPEVKDDTKPEAKDDSKPAYADTKVTEEGQAKAEKKQEADDAAAVGEQGETEKAAIVSESKPSDKDGVAEGAKTASVGGSLDAQPPSAVKPGESTTKSETLDPAGTGSSQALGTGVGVVSVASSIAGDIDEDDDSDIVSVVSDISNGVLEDELEAAKLLADAAVAVVPPPPEEEDEFESDPWNAIAVVGLRVYSKDSGITVKVIRPRDWEDGDSALDVDDSAVDATKGTDVAAPTTKVEKDGKKDEGEDVNAENGEEETGGDKKEDGEKKEDVEKKNDVEKKEDPEKKEDVEKEGVDKKEEEGSQKGEGESEGSGVML